MLILVWMFAAIINTTMVGAVVNRNNILYYPWILCAAYALWQMGRRLRTALAAMVVMIAIGFAGACGVYFTDADYQTETANTFLYGAQEALREAWDWDCDRYYLTTMSRNDGEKTMTTQVMFAHQIDYAMRSEEEELRGSDRVKSTFLADMGQLFATALQADGMEGIILNPWNRTLMLEKELIRIILGQQG